MLTHAHTGKLEGGIGNWDAVSSGSPSPSSSSEGEAGAAQQAPSQLPQEGEGASGNSGAEGAGSTGGSSTAASSTKPILPPLKYTGEPVLIDRADLKEYLGQVGVGRVRGVWHSCDGPRVLWCDRAHVV